jgi:hypothetical protein
MDEVEIDPGKDGTVVRMRKRLADPVSPPSKANGAKRRGRATETAS